MGGDGVFAYDQTDLAGRIEDLERQHRQLDNAIVALQDAGADPFTLQRMKREKLALRDHIAALRDHLIPDIIA